MGLTERMDRYQRRHRWAAFPLAVVYKFFDDQGTYLSALLAYYGFLSLFPVLLLLASVLAFALEGNPDLQQKILDSTLSQFPVVRDELGDPEGLRGSVAAVVIGGLVALYGALGVAQALQNAMNVVWAVPRHRRPNPILLRLRSLVILSIGGLAVLGTTVLAALGGSGEAYGADLGPWISVVVTLAAVLLNSAVFTLVYWIATARALRIRQLVPGAVAAGVLWQLLQLFGTAYVGRVLKGTSSTYGVFALVLGLLAWLFLAGITVVLGAEINVVRTKRLYPRALLTPFTDDVDLTRADQDAYTDAAVAQRAKGFETVEVEFEHDGQNAAHRRARAGGGDADDDSGTDS